MTITEKEKLTNTISNMENQFSRTELLIGKDAVEKLKQSHVAVFGIGGVGGFTVEALARSGIGELDLIDNDCVSLSNINRQIIATHSTIGKLKIEAARERALDINPDIKINIFNTFYNSDTADTFDFSKYDYIVDAIDTVSAKLELIERSKKSGTPVISSMGAGNKLDPTAFEVADISKTSVCPLAKVMRRELKKRGITKVKVVYSKEEPRKIELKNEQLPDGKRQIPTSIAFVPSTVGLIIAGEVIKDLIK